MDRDLLRTWLSDHPPFDDQERDCVARTLALLQAPGEIAARSHFEPGHVTASAVVVSPDETRVLLISHRDFGFWLQPGGHLDPEDADVLAAARRELQEEAGLTDLDRPDWALGLLDVDVHDIPAGLKRNEPGHQHFDVRFAFRARTLDLTPATDAKDARWFPLGDLADVETDASVRRAVARVAHRIHLARTALGDPMDKQALAALREAHGRRLRDLHLKEGWSYDGEVFETRPYWPLVPKNDTLFHLWRWDQVRPAIMAGKEVVGVGRGEDNYDRRVVSLCNPGLGGAYAATATLFADIQLLTPGEDAPSHRHTPCATRFVMEGEGWTSVTGDLAPLHHGDIVHCGPAYWHDHRNEGPGDFLFLDVLDIPLLQYLGVSEWYFTYEDVTGSADDCHYPLRPEREHMRAFEQAWAAPGFDLDDPRRYREVGHFPYKDVRPLLDKMSGQRCSETDGVLLRFRNVETGGTVGPTVDICSQLLRPGEKTAEHRHTWATILLCVEGAGRLWLDGEPQDFVRNDVMVIPGWAWHRWENPHGAPCVVHSISDLALLERLGFAREQRRDDQGNVKDTGWPAPPYVRHKPIGKVP